MTEISGIASPAHRRYSPDQHQDLTSYGHISRVRILSPYQLPSACLYRMFILYLDLVSYYLFPIFFASPDLLTHSGQHSRPASFKSGSGNLYRELSARIRGAHNIIGGADGDSRSAPNLSQSRINVERRRAVDSRLHKRANGLGFICQRACLYRDFNIMKLLLHIRINITSLCSMSLQVS